MTLGKILTNLKEQEGFSQKEMSAISGVSEYFISKYLKDTHDDPSITKVAAICESCFNVRLSQVIGSMDKLPLSTEVLKEKGITFQGHRLEMTLHAIPLSGQINKITGEPIIHNLKGKFIND